MNNSTKPDFFAPHSKIFLFFFFCLSFLGILRYPFFFFSLKLIFIYFSVEMFSQKNMFWFCLSMEV
jgi:hypothetical protein